MPPNIRTLGLQSGDPATFASFNRGTAQQIAQNTPSQAFALKLTELLKQYQQLGTRPFQEKEIQAREAQAQRVTQTPADLIGASPQIQSAARGAAVGALQPTIQEAQQSRQTFGEQLKGFSDVIGTARGLIKDYEETENKKRDDARTTINQALTLVGGGAFESLDPQEVSQLEKIAGYPKGYLQGISKTLKERELELKKQLATEKQQAAAQKAEKKVPEPVSVKLPSGETYIPRADLGEAESKFVNTALSASKLVDQAEEIYKGAVGKEYEGKGSGVAARFKGVGRVAGRVTGINEALQRYKNFIESNLSVIAKGIKGEAGALAEGDIKRARKSFPTDFSSPFEARKAFSDLRQQIRDNLEVRGQFSQAQKEGVTKSGIKYRILP